MDELNLMNLLLFLASQNSTGGSGGGGTSVYISNCSIDENGDLIVTLSDGTVMNNESYSLYYNTTDFGWSGNVITFNTVPISSTGTNMLLLSYTSGSTKDEKLKFIPTSLVTGSTNLEIAESIKSILTAGSEAIVTLDFDFNYSANNITEAIGLESVPVGDYYIAWTASSDNSQPKISSMIIM